MNATERAARTVFTAEGLSPHGWSNGPGDRYSTHSHDYRKLLVCVAGSITFHTPGGDVALAEGDRLDLPAGTPHSATVGPRGVRCLEAGAPGNGMTL
jgi:quercetin dioxygenase-like cupin family protein